MHDLTHESAQTILTVEMKRIERTVRLNRLGRMYLDAIQDAPNMDIAIMYSDLLSDIDRQLDALDALDGGSPHE